MSGQRKAKSELCYCDYDQNVDVRFAVADRKMLLVHYVAPRNCERGSLKWHHLITRKTFECVAEDWKVSPHLSISAKTSSSGEENSAQLIIGHLKRDKLNCSVHCSICRMPFKNVSALKRHMASHRASTANLKRSTTRKEKKPCVCSYCGRELKSEQTLKRHIKIHTGERDIPCRVIGCNKRFTQHSTRCFHERTHFDEKPHMCAVCGRRFKHAVGVYVHMMVHTGHRPHQCDSCPMTFRRACDLQTHSRVHTSERPYPCQTCQKSFKTKTMLNRHILALHSDEIPWRCSICDKGFKTASNLRIHMRVHTGDKPYMCADCGMQFTYSTSFKSHMLVHSEHD